MTEQRDGTALTLKPSLAREIDRYVSEWESWIERDEHGEDGPAPVIGIALLKKASEQIDMLEMTATEGREILGEIVAEIKSVSPSPADLACKCLHCRHSKGVSRLIAMVKP